MQGEVLQEAVDAFKASFQEALRQAPLLERQVARHFSPTVGRSAAAGGAPTGDAIGASPHTTPISAFPSQHWFLTPRNPDTCFPFTILAMDCMLLKHSYA